MSHKAVIGLGFGDEGKGITTDYLCSLSSVPLVVRYSGGQQAGHTVVLDGKTHVFSNFGSGTLRGIPSYWSKHCTVDPIGIVNEWDKLISKNIIPELYIDYQCPVTTPYDAYNNQVLESKHNHGTCGVGVGATIHREENHYHLTFGDLFYPNILTIKMELIKKYYGSPKIKLDRFYQCVYSIIHTSDVKCIQELPSQFENYIYEGSQGLLLDQNFGFFPHVTRSNTGSKNIIEFCPEPELFLVTRAYQTRHGNGPMTNEDIPHNIKADTNETNINNKYQGAFRRSLLDLDLLLYGMAKDAYISATPWGKNLVITCLDHVVNEYRFTYKGKLMYCHDENDFIQKIAIILGFSNVYISKSNESKNIMRWER